MSNRVCFQYNRIWFLFTEIEWRESIWFLFFYNQAIKGAIEPVGCRDFCTAIYCKMITSKKKKKSKEDWQMKGYDTSNGYMGYVEGKYILFASEQEYFEFMED